MACLETLWIPQHYEYAGKTPTIGQWISQPCVNAVVGRGLTHICLQFCGYAKKERH